MPVLLAGMLVALIGMTGLAVDFGFGTLERRVLQNAADAAAATGASDLINGVTPTSGVQAMVSQNGASVTTDVTCQYVDTANAVTGLCSAAPSNTTSGVKVTATNTRDTYFMRVLGIPTMTVSAEATARISTMQNTLTNPATSMSYNAQNALFIVCGYNTKLVGGGNMNILQGAQPGISPWDLNPAAIDPANPKEFIIHDPQPEDCGIHSSSFKGLNKTVGMVTLPADLQYETGTNAGPTQYAINGFNGCGANLNSSTVDGCVMILPIATEVRTSNALGQPYPDGERLRAVRWLPFRIRQVDSNTTAGTLLGTYILNDSLLPWTYSGGNASGITSVRVIH
jgi:Flp pilus assembly protein TadG